ENLVNNLARVSEWNLIQLTLKLAANFQIHIILTLSKVETGIKNNEGGINLRYGKSCCFQAVHGRGISGKYPQSVPGSMDLRRKSKRCHHSSRVPQFGTDGGPNV